MLDATLRLHYALETLRRTRESADRVHPGTANRSVRRAQRLAVERARRNVERQAQRLAREAKLPR